ncbi:phosphoribosylformylglycinamidine synthase [Lutispora thermophila]|uniref:Phosphoribosylformylglycinamidine synthase n=1 Tax=Lutispora thermophila DSM 19022 TaxID=1122184 RepID=A0A1M6AXE0_9FIRM|nr:phosphoribosylformylglycinamidine synthase [Lutispora thermophila]SHI41112.1 phosphoribosylformylglycinamidine synthase [Lutispora thermophila DSM 19022]
MSKVRRIFVEKKPEFAVESKALMADLKENLGIKGLEGLRIIKRYDVEGISHEVYEKAKFTIFSEPPVDYIYEEELELDKKEKVFAVEYLPGQYDQRADSAAQCLQILGMGHKPEVRTANVIILKGNVSEEELSKIKSYYINPVEMREAELKKYDTLTMEIDTPDSVAVLEGFIDMGERELQAFKEELGLAMSFEDLAFCQSYFRDTEKRNPTITEIRVIDTYWSDHCRHTTFNTIIENVHIEEGKYKQILEKAFDMYRNGRSFVYRDKEKPMCLMDLAQMAMKEMRKKGELDDLEISDEINACSIEVEADVDGRKEKWLVMFKNETHNHPTEIEPFGGAATCLGGAIRDPLSGRSYVYGAMRLTGSGDPRTPVSQTLSGKLPQRKITTGAANGYSSYGNQIGLATGQVAEVYHEGFVAKRMEIGAVVGAAPKANVVRKAPVPGDIVILMGGRTGRDGCGGATGSSKEHDEKSLATSGPEVQKGNAPTERKIQRLFRNPEISRMIKKCNDFGAGGVSVAIGELAEGLYIDLDAVPKKYEGLDGTELAISESQERMAVLIAPEDEEKFIKAAREENLEAVAVAKVTDDRRLTMVWKGNTIVDISREFLDTSGIRQRTNIKVAMPEDKDNFYKNYETKDGKVDIKKVWMKNLEDLNVCSQKGLVEKFDATIGSNTVLMPFGGIYQATPSEGLVMKLPVLGGDTTTGTVMTYGYNPYLSSWSPFHGALYAVVHAVSKVAALGGDYRKIRLTLQEYFEKLGKDEKKWGKPFAALLGAYFAQKQLGISAIGGKDSMSGTFLDLNVPPTLVAFALAPMDVTKAVSQEFKAIGSQVILLPVIRDENHLPDFEALKKTYERLRQLINAGFILSSSTVKEGGLAAAITKMCFGNRIGVRLFGDFDHDELFAPDFGSIIIEMERDTDVDELLQGIAYRKLGLTWSRQSIYIREIEISLKEAYGVWTKTLETIFPTKAEKANNIFEVEYRGRNINKPSIKHTSPRVLIPVFPGTNCEYDTARAFEDAGGKADIMVIRNLTPQDIEESIKELVRRIDNSQILALPGGFSGGDEPDGSGKFIAAVFRNDYVKEAVMNLLYKRDGLIIGICNGFQALIKLGLLPYGHIRDIDENSPTLTYNKIGRHVSQLVRTKVVSTLSPWFAYSEVGDIHTIPVSHGEGRFVASEDMVRHLANKGQIATQYVDLDGNAAAKVPYNPNGSICAIEAITSPDGRILGKMAHSERVGRHLYKNVPGEKEQNIFRAGVDYFAK